MGQVAADTDIYSYDNPGNLEMAAFIASMYKWPHKKDKLGMNPKETARMNRLMDEYTSLRYSAYERQCPVTVALDQAQAWADKEERNGWRRFDGFMDFVSNVAVTYDEVKDW